MNFEKIIILTLSLLLVWFGATIVRLENYHYAVQTGFCIDASIEQRDSCLNKTETRTSSLWHLLYGLQIIK